MSLFKAVAKENLIEQAAKVNETEGSADPAAALSANEFDAVLRKIAAAPDATDMPSEGGDAPADGAPTDGPTDAPEGDPADAPEADADKPSEDDDGADDAESEDDLQPEQRQEPQEDPTEKVEQALEGIAILKRCLETIEQAHATGVLSPAAATVANITADTVQADLGLVTPAVPAVESDKPEGEQGRFARTRDRILALIKAAWAALQEWVLKAVKWVREFRQGYKARKGIYDKNAQGYKMRLKALMGQMPADQAMNFKAALAEVSLGGLSHNGRLQGVEGLQGASDSLSTLAVAVANVCTTVNPMTGVESVHAVIAKMQDHPIADLTDIITSVNVPGAFRATTSSSILTARDADLTQEYKGPNGKVAGYFQVDGIPGGLGLNWTFGNNDGFKSLEEAATEISKVSFSLVRDPAKETKEAMEVDLAGLQKLLACYDNVSANHDKVLDALARVEKIYTTIMSFGKVVFSSIEKKSQLTNSNAGDTQDLLRVYSLQVASYERAFVRPIHEMVRALSNAQKTLLSISGAALVEMDTQVKAAAKPAA